MYFKVRPGTNVHASQSAHNTVGEKTRILPHLILFNTALIVGPAPEDLLHLRHLQVPAKRKRNFRKESIKFLH